MPRRTPALITTPTPVRAAPNRVWVTPGPAKTPQSYRVGVTSQIAAASAILPDEVLPPCVPPSSAPAPADSTSRILPPTDNSTAAPMSGTLIEVLPVSTSKVLAN